MSDFFAACGANYGRDRVFIIAEVGTGHGGDLAKARELIAAAAESGADCAKFQYVIADEIVHPATGIVPLPGGDIRIYDRFKALEAGEDFYRSVREECIRRGLVFLCAPFGVRSARSLRHIGSELFKIASPELNHRVLLDEIASYESPVILSSGVSKLGDIEQAITRLRPARRSTPRGSEAGAAAPAQRPHDLALLHCVTAYPAPAEDYNLRILPNLSGIFGLPVGVSDHSLDPVLVPALAVAMGGVIVEKHICLSRNDSGLDDPIALPPEDFARMTAAVRRAQSQESEATIAEIAARYGEERVEAVLGDGVKRLALSEERNYGRTNRTIHAVVDIERGAVFSEGNLALLRTEKILRPGLPPELLDVLLGRRAARSIPAGEGIEWADVGGFS